MSRGAESIIYIYILFVNFRAYASDITFLYYSQKHCIWLVFVLQFKHFISYIVEVVTRTILFSRISFNHADYDSSRFIVSFFHQNFNPVSQVLYAQKKAADWFNPLPSSFLFNLRDAVASIDDTNRTILMFREHRNAYRAMKHTPPPRASPRCGSGGRCTPHTKLRRVSEAPTALCRSP